MSGKKIIVIGAINMDIAGVPNGKIIAKDSNIGKISLSFGGVGRNIAENLARMGEDLSMLTAFGDDMFGREIKNDLTNLNIDTTLSQTYPCNTSSYLYVADCHGEMQVAVNDMDIYEKITVDSIKKVEDKLNSYDVIVLDTNLTFEVLNYCLKNLTPKKAVDPVSTIKAEKIKDLLGYIDLLKPNKMEAEVLSGIKITNDNEGLRAAEYFIEKGVKNLFISMGEQGCIFAGGEKYGKLPIIKTEIKNATGCGDAFMAGAVKELIKSGDSEKMCLSGIAASSIALQSNDTVNKNMSEKLLNKIIEEGKRI